MVQDYREILSKREGFRGLEQFANAITHVTIYQNCFPAQKEPSFAIQGIEHLSDLNGERRALQQNTMMSTKFDKLRDDLC